LAAHLPAAFNCKATMPSAPCPHITIPILGQSNNITASPLITLKCWVVPYFRKRSK
jgi:hypothetical protein